MKDSSFRLLILYIHNCHWVNFCSWWVLPWIFCDEGLNFFDFGFRFNNWILKLLGGFDSKCPYFALTSLLHWNKTIKFLSLNCVNSTFKILYSVNYEWKQSQNLSFKAQNHSNLQFYFLKVIKTYFWRQNFQILIKSN